MAGYLGSVNLRSVTRIAERNKSVIANTSIFPQDIKGEMIGSSIWTIQCSFANSGKLEVITKQPGSTDISEILNSSIIANQDYLYTFITSDKESINFKFSVNSTCKRFILMESGGIY